MTSYDILEIVIVCLIGFSFFGTIAYFVVYSRNSKRKIESQQSEISTSSSEKVPLVNKVS